MTAPYVGRYAPSPSGSLHLGNLLAAVAAYARARQAGGRIVLRMEDIDTPRMKPGAAEAMLDDLAFLGFQFDAGPHDDAWASPSSATGRAHESVPRGAPFTQSLCHPRYEAALAQLWEKGFLFACRCSRKDIQRAASAPHAGEHTGAYPGTCRHLGLPRDGAQPVAWRVRVPAADDPARLVTIQDALCGPLTQDLAHAVGDFVLRRKDGLFAYQLAVVVDDGAQGVTEVVRGRDLRDSAPRQTWLARALGLTPPTYAHVPLWVGPDGARLAKRTGAQTLGALRDAGESASAILGRVGRALGVASGPITLDALVARATPAVWRVAAVTDDGPVHEDRP